MTERTPPDDQPRHSLRVLDGGLSPQQRLLDDVAAIEAQARLAEEIAEAARLCDRLEADGLRIAFELDDSKPGVRVSVRDDDGRDVLRLDCGQAADIKKLTELTGIA